MRSSIEMPLNSQVVAAPFADLLVKAVEEGGKWVVYLEASNENLDQDNEITLSKALQEAADFYKTHGIISWDHGHRVHNDPAFIIGEPLDVAFSKREDGKSNTLIKGVLYKENKRAQGVWENIQSGAQRLGSSVGGYILKKSKELDGSGKISKVYWDDTAITYKPVNDTTYGMVSSLSFPEFMKAMTAGEGVDAASFTGGRALSGEDLAGADSAQVLSIEQSIDLWNGVWKNIKNGSINNYESLCGFVTNAGFSSRVAHAVAEMLYQKLPQIAIELRQ